MPGRPTMQSRTYKNSFGEVPALQRVDRARKTTSKVDESPKTGIFCGLSIRISCPLFQIAITPVFVLSKNDLLHQNLTPEKFYLVLLLYFLNLKFENTAVPAAGHQIFYILNNSYLAG